MMILAVGQYSKDSYKAIVKETPNSKATNDRYWCYEQSKLPILMSKKKSLQMFLYSKVEEEDLYIITKIGTEWNSCERCYSSLYKRPYVECLICQKIKCKLCIPLYNSQNQYLC